MKQGHGGVVVPEVRLDNREYLVHIVQLEGRGRGFRLPRDSISGKEAHAVDIAKQAVTTRRTSIATGANAA